VLESNALQLFSTWKVLLSRRYGAVQLVGVDLAAHLVNNAWPTNVYIHTEAEFGCYLPGKYHDDSIATFLVSTAPGTPH
jgi:hypothetical protein